MCIYLYRSNQSNSIISIACLVQILRQFKDLKHVDADGTSDVDGAKKQQSASGGDDEDQHMMLMDDSHLDDD